MKRMLALLMTLMLLTGLCACGAGSSGASGDTAASSSGGATNEMTGTDSGWSNGSTQDASEESEGQSSASVYQDAKLIRRAYLQVQTETFDQAVESLEKMVAECGGYFQSASVEGGSLRNQNATRWGNYTIRLPQEQFDTFLGRTGELGYVTSQSEKSENVSQQYYDTEARLKAQRTKQERLLALLEQAEAMEDIISLENALSEVEYQIEQYTTTLNRYDALISFSTFTIDLEEVSAVSQEVGTSASLGTRLAAGLASSASGLLDGAREGLVWLSYHLFQILIPLAAAAVGMLCWWRFHRKKAGGGGEKDDPS